MKRCGKTLVTGAALALVISAGAHGQDGSGLGFEELRVSLGYRVYAPAWVWQGVPVNIIVIFEPAREARTLEVALEPGDGVAVAFDLPPAEELNKTMEVPAETVVRVVFTGLRARHGGVLSHYPFYLHIDGREEGETILIKTVRGSAFISERWSLVALIALAGVWCAVVARAMQKLAGRGAWRGESDPFEVAEAPSWAREGKES